MSDVKENWPIDYCQTVYAIEPGSAAISSPGPAFTPQLLTRLVAVAVETLEADTSTYRPFASGAAGRAAALMAELL
jgi:S-adenosylmethionine:tRNA-ribosyltransferase-isomerase (queuine synthetase)